MTAAYFEEHPTDPDKVVMRKPKFDDDDIQEYTRPWKGVSEREIPDIYIGDVAFLHGVKWAEAKLKERNHG